MGLKGNASWDLDTSTWGGRGEGVGKDRMSERTVKKPAVETSEAKDSAEKPKDVRKNFGLLIIKDQISNSKDEDESRPKIEKKTIKPSFAKIEFIKSKEQAKSSRKIAVKQAHSIVKSPIQSKTAFKNSFINQRVNTVRNKYVNTTRPKAIVNVVLGSRVNVVKASSCLVWKPKIKGNPQQNLQEKGVIDSGCLRHMTWNMSYLTYYKEINEGYVTFEGNPKGGKITSKGTIRTALELVLLKTSRKYAKGLLLLVEDLMLLVQVKVVRRKCYCY
nr:hypothetical protein [Tanacetum cinerariifolium]